MKYSLPDSSNDLLIKDGKLLMRALGVYEILRRFGHILRLTAYRFEDFTAALLADDQSALLAEIHIQLLKTLIREDRQQQTWLGPPDIRDSVNLYMQMVDHSNWPAALDIYLSADPLRNADILAILDGGQKGCYPFSSTLETRLFVLEDLCDRLLLSVLARDDIVGVGTSVEKQIDKNCRICSKANGDLTSCKVCLGNFHLKCSYPNNLEKPVESRDLDDESRSSINGVNGANTHTCKICRDNHVQGVTDCISEQEKFGNLKRHEALGLDKLGRRYWFVIRRLFVVDETEDDVRYYTNIRELREIIESLNENRHEVGLMENLTSQQEEIERQMQITQDLYSTLMKDHRNVDGSYSLSLGQNGLHRNYTNNFPSIASSKLHSSDRDMLRNLNNKFCMTNQIKWNGAINGHLNTITTTVRSSILKFEALLPGTFIHTCWRVERIAWVKSVNQAQTPLDFARALTKLETCIKPVLFKSAWYDSLGFLHLFRSTYFEREEMKKNDRQPRGFERNERTTADFELSYRLGTMVKFSPKLKPVKHQVWKQKGEEYRLTGLNGWYWHGITRRSRCLSKPKLYHNDSYRWCLSTTNHPFVQDMINKRIESQDVIDVSYDLNQKDEQHRILYPKIPKYNSYKQARIDKIEGLLQKKLSELERIRQEKEKQATIQQQEPTTNGIAGGDTSNVKPILTNGIIATPTSIQIKIETNGFKANVNPTTLSNTNQATGDIKKVNNVVTTKRNTTIKPKLPPTHDFLTKRGKMRCIFVLPNLELRRVARSGGQKEARTFSYTAKPNFYVWPYGITPRPTFRTCWLYRNELATSIQEVALNLKVINANLRWDDLQTRPPACGHNVITLDEATITIELLKKRDKLPYMTHSEYLIRKTTTPTEQPSTKYRKIGTKKSAPSARSGLRARRQAEEEDERKPTREEIWVSEFQLELWELKQFDEKIERHTVLARERAQREEAAKRRQADEAKRRAADAEKRRLKAQQDEANKRVRLSTPIITYQNNKVASPATPPCARPNANNSINIPIQPSNTTPQQGSQTRPTTPVLRYIRTEQGVIQFPASYLRPGTPLIFRHVAPGTNQTNTYIIKTQDSSIGSSPTGNNVNLRLMVPANMIRPQVQPLSTMRLSTAPLPSAPQPQPPAAQSPTTVPLAATAPAPQPNIKLEPATVAQQPQPQPPPQPPAFSVPIATTAGPDRTTTLTTTTAASAPPAPLPTLTTAVPQQQQQSVAQATTTTVSSAAPTPTPQPNIKVEPETITTQPSPLTAFSVPIATTAEPDATTTLTTTTATTTPATQTISSEIEAEQVIPNVKTEPVVVNESERPIMGATDNVVASESGNENETNGAEKSETSVGTVANEMAHDQHAPPPQSPVNEPRVSQQIKVEGSAASAE